MRLLVLWDVDGGGGSDARGREDRREIREWRESGWERWAIFFWKINYGTWYGEGYQDREGEIGKLCIHGGKEYA